MLFVSALSRFFGSSSGGYQANFSYTLYGLVTGGKTWSFVYNDPRMLPLFKAEESQLAKIIYEQSWVRFKENPLLLIIGLTKSTGGFLKFIFANSWGGSTKFIRICFALLNFSVVSTISWRFYKNRHLYMRDFIFIIFVFVGVLLSSSIIWTDAGYRVFCTVPALYGLFAALGVFPKVYLANQSENTTNQNLCLGSIFLFLCITVAPVISFLKPMQLIPPQEWAIPSNEKDVYIAYNLNNQPGFMVADHASTFSVPAQLTKETFLRSLNQNDSPMGEMFVQIASEMKQFYVVSTYDFIRKNTYKFVLEKTPLSSKVLWFKLKVHKRTENDSLLFARIEESK